MAENFQIREVFNADILASIAADIKEAYPQFNCREFKQSIIPLLDNLTYSERKNLITLTLERCLPDHFPHALTVLLSILPPEIDGDDISGSGNRFYISCFTAFISRNGMDHFDRSMHGLYEMTKRFTAEWDLRPFLIQYQEKTFQYLYDWLEDPNPHVRRLVSEGTRPYLPWGKKLLMVEKDPTLTLPLLEKLSTDNSSYVRRSVANHLNDIAKKHPGKVVQSLKQWNQQYPSIEMEKLTRHALRTLIKDGHKGALELLGYSYDVLLTLKNFTCTSQVPEEGDFHFSFDLKSQSNKDQKIIVDFIIHFQKSDGRLSPKVFKLKNAVLPKRGKLNFQKIHSFRPITTRKYYPGLHAVEIQVNGNRFLKRNFQYT